MKTDSHRTRNRKAVTADVDPGFQATRIPGSRARGSRGRKGTECDGRFTRTRREFQCGFRCSGKRCETEIRVIPRSCNPEVANGFVHHQRHAPSQPRCNHAQRFSEPEPWSGCGPVVILAAGLRLIGARVEPRPPRAKGPFPYQPWASPKVGFASSASPEGAFHHNPVATTHSVLEPRPWGGCGTVVILTSGSRWIGARVKPRPPRVADLEKIAPDFRPGWGKGNDASPGRDERFCRP